MGIVTLTFAIGAGVPMLGRPYNPRFEVTVTNGRLNNRTEFAGIVLQLFVGAMAYILLANLVPSLVVLDFSLPTLRVLVGTFCALCILGCTLVMYFLIEPQKTYDVFNDDSEVIGIGDPIVATMGSFHFIGFLYLTILSGAVLMRMIPVFTSLRHAVKRMTLHYRPVLFFCMMLLLWYVGKEIGGMIRCFTYTPMTCTYAFLRTHTQYTHYTQYTHENSCVLILLPPFFPPFALQLQRIESHVQPCR